MLRLLVLVFSFLLLRLVRFSHSAPLVRSFVRSFVRCFQNLLKISIFFRISVDFAHLYQLFFNFLKVQNTQIWAKITGRAYVRGGRGHFTEIKFDEIRSRCGKFGDILVVL